MNNVLNLKKKLYGNVFDFIFQNLTKKNIVNNLVNCTEKLLSRLV